MLRFRPIMMTTMAAILGALPMALGTGTGSELRRPLGISIVGGLIVSQLLTLYTTPVIYLVMDRMRLRFARRRRHYSTAGARRERTDLTKLGAAVLQCRSAAVRQCGSAAARSGGRRAGGRSRARSGDVAAGCVHPPKYEPPKLSVPAAYKEAGADMLQPAQPAITRRDRPGGRCSATRS